MNTGFFKINGPKRVEKIKAKILKQVASRMDLESSERIVQQILLLLDHTSSPNNDLIHGLTLAAIVTYARPFNSRFGASLGFEIFDDRCPPTASNGYQVQLSERGFHGLVMNYRNRHLAHSDDFLKAGDVGGSNQYGLVAVAPLLASRMAIEDKSFYHSLLRIASRAKDEVQHRIENSQQMLINLIQSGEAVITALPSQITPVPKGRDVLDMWGL